MFRFNVPVAMFLCYTVRMAHGSQQQEHTTKEHLKSFTLQTPSQL